MDWIPWIEYGYEWMDWTSWLRCRSVSKNASYVVQSGICPRKRDFLYTQERLLIRNRNLSKLHICLRGRDAQRQAADAAAKMISVDPWTDRDPRCCYLYCEGEANGKTGVWAPRHVPRRNMSFPDEELVQRLWWRNGKAGDGRYGSSDPQMLVTDWLERFEAPNMKYYVVCCEACGEAVRYHAHVLRMGTRCTRDIQVILGVDRLLFAREAQMVRLVDRDYLRGTLASITSRRTSAASTASTASGPSAASDTSSIELH